MPPARWSTPNPNEGDEVAEDRPDDCAGDPYRVRIGADFWKVIGKEKPMSRKQYGGLLIGTVVCNRPPQDQDAGGSGNMSTSQSVEEPSEQAWPTRQWAEASPNEMGMDSEVLGRGRDFALRHGGAGCVVRSGRLVCSWGDTTERIHVYSATKGIGATLLGLALDEGKLRLSDRAAEHHPDFGVPPESNRETGWLEEINILHLATHTAGFDKDRGYTALQFRPGSMFMYSDGGTNWLAECLTLAYGQDLYSLLTERVLVHLGVGKEQLMWDVNDKRPDPIEGIKRLPLNAHIWASADALARIGLLYLRGGEWNGRRIISREFIDQLRRPVAELARVPTHPNNQFGLGMASHGLLWWNNADGRLPGVPTDAYWTHGLNDNLIIVVPSLDLVVSRTADRQADWQPNPYQFPDKNIEPFLAPVAASIRNTKVVTLPVEAPKPAYPPSRWIRGLIIEADRISIGHGDNWPMTWGDDGHLYTVYCDGQGWGDRRFSMAMAKVMGEPPGVSGVNIPSPTGEHGPDDTGYDIHGRKASGLVMADGVLYMWVRNLNPADGTGSSLAWSTDRARTWTWASWTLPECGYPVWLNAGRDYADGPDDYLYFYWPKSPSAYAVTDAIDLGRVHRDRATSRDEYEFFTGTDGEGRPTWRHRIDECRPVFESPAGCYRPCVTYNPGLRRYLLCTITPARHFGLFDAPQPWGPRTTARTTDRFGPGERRFAPQIPSKWINADGTVFHLVYSCHPCGPYKLNIQKCRLMVTTE
ncbi:MAG: hypothetical protein AMS16_00685 [Planctomycetes bacterium DG_58]|nr:MAG: hypothetical protein AMS16_00685 [Planctomycetes bacterium DG_58]